MQTLKSLLSRALILYLLAAVVLGALGDLRKAHVRRLNGLRDWSPYPVSFAAGQAAWDALSFRRAIRYYQIFTTVLPFSARGEEMVGYCYFHLKDFPRAYRYYARALAKEPSYFWLEYNLGILAYVLGNKAEAETRFLKVLQIDPGEQERAAVLGPLRTVTPAQRALLLGLVRKFVEQIRKDSARMQFILHASTPAFPLQKEKVEQLQLHPWAYYVAVGKEMVL